MWFIFDVLTAFTNMGLIVSGCSLLVLFVITVLLTNAYPWLWTVLEWGYGIFAVVVVGFLLVALFVKGKDEYYGVFGFIKRFVMWAGFALMFAGGFVAIKLLKQWHFLGLSLNIQLKSARQAKLVLVMIIWEALLDSLLRKNILA